MKKILIIAFVLITINSLAAQPVIQAPNSINQMTDSWKWAVRQSGEKNFDDGFWIGYSIERLMGLHSHIGRYCRSHENRPSLAEIIYGEEQARECLPTSAEEQIQKATHNVLDDWDDDENEKQVLKEVAFLFRFDSQQDAENAEIRDMTITNMSLYTNLEDLPLLWLGIQESDQSIDFLTSKYSKAKSEDVKEELIVAVALHGESKRITDFLKDIVQSDEDDELREDAVFWLSQQQSKQALDILKKTIEKDHSVDVREKAVFGLSQMDLKGAMDVLIDLAKNARHSDIREKAIFWLSQKAGKKALETLSGLIDENDESYTIKEKAIFALSQLDDNEGVPHLIRIANTHPDRRLRKKAIFWLGQTEDERAVQALIDILQNQ